MAEGDRAAVERLLAPEFQILRSDGIGYDKAGYLAALPEHLLAPEVHDVQASGDSGSLVIRYTVTVDEIVRGQSMRGTAPRLSALRRAGETWLMVAHANFAPHRLTVAPATPPAAAPPASTRCPAAAARPGS